MINVDIYLFDNFKVNKSHKMIFQFYANILRF